MYECDCSGSLSHGCIDQLQSMIRRVSVLVVVVQKSLPRHRCKDSGCILLKVGCGLYNTVLLLHARQAQLFVCLYNVLKPLCCTAHNSGDYGVSSSVLRSLRVAESGTDTSKAQQNSRSCSCYKCCLIRRGNLLFISIRLRHIYMN